MTRTYGANTGGEINQPDRLRIPILGIFDGMVLRTTADPGKQQWDGQPHGVWNISSTVDRPAPSDAGHGIETDTCPRRRLERKQLLAEIRLP